MIGIAGFVAHVLALVCAIGYGITFVAWQNNLPRFYSPKYFPLFAYGYLTGMCICATVVGFCMGASLLR